MRHALFAMALLLSLPPVGRGAELDVLPSEIDGVAPGDMMNAYLMEKAYDAFDRRKAAYEEMDTPEELTKYQQRMKQFFIDQLGGFPERTPLRAQVVERRAMGGYRLEKVIFESQPRHFVTGVLYLPESKPPYPGVLIPCGHSANGKASDLYQRAGIFLARMGIAAFCYDPIGQGERYQILDENGKPRFGGTHEHTLVGVGSILLGTNTARYRVWDGMRAIDYMVSRDEIDPARIGCTGNSGGGTLTSYLMALDDRIACAAPSCYLTSLKRLLETIGPQDAEQNIHAQIAGGMDHADYVMMRAPKPTLMCAATRDFFDIEGTWNSFREAKRFYTRMAFPERLNLVEADETHGFSPPLRLGMVRWMRRWLLEATDPVVEPQIEVFSDAEMQCSPEGQVMLMDGARSVFDINAEIENKLAQERRAFWRETDKAEALKRVRETAGIRDRESIPPARPENVGTVNRKGYTIEKMVLSRESSIYLPALLFRPAESKGGLCLYLHGEGKQVDAGEEGPIEKRVQAGQTVLAVDLRGIGETESKSGSDRWQPYFGSDWKDYFLAYMLDKTYVGMRTEDIVSAAGFLGTLGSGGLHEPIELVAIGETGPPALHAAALEPDLFGRVKIERSVVSWSNVVKTPVSRGQLINAVHGALRVYDLPDLATCVGDRLEIVDPVDAAGDPVD